MRNTRLFSGTAMTAFLIFILIVILPACTSTAPTVLPTPPPGIGYLVISMVDLDEAVAGVDVKVYAGTVDQNNVIYSGAQSIIYYYDVTPSTAQGKPAITSPSTYKQIKQTEDQTTNWKNTPPGIHTFSV